MHTDPHEAILSSFGALRRSIFFVLALAILAGVIAYGITLRVPGKYEVHFSYMISMDQQDPASGFRYDGYYALSSADLFATTLASITSSPETIVAAYAEAHIELPTQDPITLTRGVRAEKTAPQLVQVTVIHASKQTAEALAKALTRIVESSVDAYNTKGLSTIVFHVIPTDPWTGFVNLAALPIAVSVFTLFFFGGCMVVLLREAIKRGENLA